MTNTMTHGYYRRKALKEVRARRAETAKIIRQSAIGADECRRLGVFFHDPSGGHDRWNKPTRRVIVCTRWSRDCDMAEGTSIVAYPATLRAYERAAQSLYDAAEGPCSLSIMSHDELPFLADVEVGVRDRALEAFEDGHPHVIY